MKSLYRYITESLDNNIFWKIDKFFERNQDELRSFNGLIDICRSSKSYNKSTVEAYINGNEDLYNILKTFVDFIEDIVHKDNSINKDYYLAMYNIVKVVVNNKSEGMKYTNMK